MTTLTTLIGRVRPVLRDTSGDFVTDTMITQWINEAITDLAARQEIVESEFTGTTSGNTIALPPSGSTETMTIQSLALGDAGDDVVFVDRDIWQMYSDAAASPTYTLGNIWNDYIYLYPTPDTGTAYTLRATSTPAPMTLGTDIQPLPAHLERKITDYALAYGMYAEGEVGRGDRYMAMYEQGLFPIATGREDSRPGPTTLVPIEGPFDADIEAKHW